MNFSLNLDLTNIIHTNVNTGDDYLRYFEDDNIVVNEPLPNNPVEYEAMYVYPPPQNELENYVETVMLEELSFVDLLGPLQNYEATPIQPPPTQNNETGKCETFIMNQFSCRLECRTGRNLPWAITNNAPRLMHKSRRIALEAPATGVPFTVIFKAKKISGDAQGEICFLSSAESVSKQLNEDLLKIGDEVKIRCNGRSKELISCFLHTAVCRQQQSGNAVYEISISCSVNNSNTLVHSFETKPLRNHKWESGNKGKHQNSVNCSPINRDIPFPQNKM